ncbi:hypothetical protein ACTHQ4_02350 [Alkalicoccobacillus gibsonii]|uniref:hypothetical protein n=1 Tax=Alkalicoccobacillus gibsonii TaxID=79881 RepID=UPI003F7C73F0
MSLNQLVIDTLKPLGVPVSFARYNLTADTYIVFVNYNEAPRLIADDNELITKNFIQMDVFSKGNYLQLNKDIKRLMKAAGFGRMFASETYDEDLKMFRKIYRFNYENKIGEEL